MCKAACSNIIISHYPHPSQIGYDNAHTNYADYSGVMSDQPNDLHTAWAYNMIWWWYLFCIWLHINCYILTLNFINSCFTDIRVFFKYCHIANQYYLFLDYTTVTKSLRGVWFGTATCQTIKFPETTTTIQVSFVCLEPKWYIGLTNHTHTRSLGWMAFVAKIVNVMMKPHWIAHF